MNQANKTGGFRMTKVDGVRPPYRTGEIKINQRRLKRLKNRLWKMCKKRKTVLSRIKTHFGEIKIPLDQPEYSLNFKIYTEFYQKWRKWKQANPKILSAILNSKHASIYHIYKLMNQTEVNA